MKKAAILLISVCGLLGQDAPKATPAEQDLRNRMAEAGNSPVEFQRALEKHLERFPDNPQRPDIEKALFKASVELKDNRRVILYGEMVIGRDASDLVALERVTRALLSSEEKEPNQKALKYSKLFHDGLRALEKQKPESGRMDAQLRDDLDRGMNRSLVFQARATGNLGNVEEAIQLAKQAYGIVPTGEAARELGKWLAKAGRDAEALPALAAAFVMPDTRVTEAERATSRIRLGEVWKKSHKDETGLGDVILQAYDRTTAELGERKLKLKQLDPNAQVTDPMEYTITSIDGRKLGLASLKGKVVVLDFWATWCGPCRAQYPLYEQVKERFQERGDVVFLGINTDEDRSLVPGFVKDMKWNKAVYYEDGLAGVLKVSSIPTTIIFNKKGELVSRLNGFVPERFVEMLGDRIQDTLAQ